LHFRLEWCSLIMKRSCLAILGEIFRKNGTTTIWIWKHWNNLMVDNCSKRNSNWEIDDWMVRTEVKISMEKKNFYMGCKRGKWKLCSQQPEIEMLLYLR
jgi:hypothetical protein